jgi:hypothetical protein
MAECAKAYPHIADFVHPANPEARSDPGCSRLRDHAVTLARQGITEEMEAMRKKQHEGNAADTANVKGSILAKLKRLLPGSPNVILAIQQEDGEVTTEPEQMAAALQAHWKKVFTKKEIDADKLQRWLESLPARPPATRRREEEDELPWHGVKEVNGGAQHGSARRPLPTDPRSWKAQRKDIQQALKDAGNSAPGPDGIPFSAWRACKELGLSVLHDVAGALEKGNAEAQLCAAYADVATEGDHHYNLSTLVCLPKAPSGDDVEFGEFYTPAGTRPLSIVNCDNRLVASAMRLRWEDNIC